LSWWWVHICCNWNSWVEISIWNNLLICVILATSSPGMTIVHDTTIMFVIIICIPLIYAWLVISSPWIIIMHDTTIMLVIIICIPLICAMLVINSPWITTMHDMTIMFFIIIRIPFMSLHDFFRIITFLFKLVWQGAGMIFLE
jgi:hypothetical protein